ncbi:MAG: GGDEF domain-containing protein [Rhodospirillales bacterium]
MEFSGTPKQAEDYARAALDLMARQGIVPTPGNFAVWFHYFSEKYPELHRTLESLLDGNHRFTDAENDELFQRFFGLGREAAALQEASRRIEEELGKILKYIDSAGEGAAAYGKALESASGKIESADEPTSLKTVITNLMTATRAMQQSNAAIENRLHSSTHEISRLRGDLEAMRQEALTDSLTGIANRKLFDMELRRAVNEAVEANDELSLLMIDIDHFKQFNDNYGHQVGDQVLKLLAMTLSSIVKGQDTAARYGGEEFAVILPRTSLENARKLAEVIRKTINGKKVINRSTNEDLGQISVSIGVGAFVSGDAVGQVIARADSALYAAKSGGRNRVVAGTDNGGADLTVGFRG